MLVVAFLVVKAIVGSKSFQNCVCTNQKEQQPGLEVYALLRCGGAFLEAHNGAISATASLIIAVFTCTLWWATTGMLQASADQSAAMERSISEAARAASAMEAVAGHFADNVAAVKELSYQQMRAYVSVAVHGGIYQERDKNLKFEAKPAMLNTGHTPAHRVGYKARAEILPIPLRSDLAFPLPDKINGAASLGPQQPFLMSAIVDEFCEDADVGAIKSGTGRALCVWGVITYKDVFGNEHYTEFFQILTWLPDGKIFGYYPAEHNEST